MIYRYTQISRYKRPRPIRSKLRPGQVRDREYLAWLHSEPCLIHKGVCRWVEAHHVDKPRNDRRAVPLCAEMHREGPEAVHVIGRRRFEARFEISFEAAIAGLNQEYEQTKGRKIA